MICVTQYAHGAFVPPLFAMSPQVLTLVSNERVPLSDAMRMVFEINSLKNATPATVSRAGILFINETGEHAVNELPFNVAKTRLLFLTEYPGTSESSRPRFHPTTNHSIR